MNALLTGASSKTLNPQNDAPRVKGFVGEGLLFRPPRPGEGRRGRQHASEQAHQRAERHYYCKSPHGDHPPPRHRTVARCRAYHPAAGHAAAAIADVTRLTTR